MLLTGRNYLSASMLSHGSYLFDLEAQGWFGQAQDPATADTIWQTMAAAAKAVAKVDLGSGPLPSHEVAVFFDEASAATQPLDSRLLDAHNASSRTISGDYTLVSAAALFPAFSQVSKEMLHSTTARSGSPVSAPPTSTTT